MSRIDALQRERIGYVARNMPDRVAQVDAELARLGHKVQRETATAEGAPEKATQPRPARPAKPKG